MRVGANQQRDILMRSRRLAAACVVFAGLLSADANAQSSRLWNLFTGARTCLDIVNDGKNNTVTLAECANVSGQLWLIEPSETEGFFRLKTTFSGSDKCLDIINDDEDNKLSMAECSPVSGQLWKLEPSEPKGFSRVENMFTGPGKCLDVINDADDKNLTMAECGAFFGQLWGLSQTP
jgi:hypothetical protein